MNEAIRRVVTAGSIILIAIISVPVSGRAQFPAEYRTFQETLNCPRLTEDAKATYRCQIEIYTRYRLATAADLAKRQLATTEAIECHDKNEKLPIDEAIITTYKCQIEIYAKYGVATAKELAETRESLAREEERRRQSAEHYKRCQQAAPISIGMTVDQVLASRWGQPSERRRTTTATHLNEQWIYEDGPACGPLTRLSCLYFEDGILTVIQD
jgi:Protein of unknown function (DUF2845)